MDAIRFYDHPPESETPDSETSEYETPESETPLQTLSEIPSAEPPRASHLPKKLCFVNTTRFEEPTVSSPS